MDAEQIKSLATAVNRVAETAFQEGRKHKGIDIYAVVEKLIGAIEPIGDSGIDKVRFENLKATTELIEALLTDISDVANRYENNHQDSMQKACKFAKKFLAEVEL